MSRVVQVAAHVVELSYGPRVTPYQWSGGSDTRFFSVLAEAVGERHTGWGESAGSSPTSDPLVRVPGLLEPWLDAAADVLLGESVADYRRLGALVTSSPLPARSGEQDDGLPAPRAWHSTWSSLMAWGPIAVAMQLALYDLFGREAGVGLGDLLGPPGRDFVELATAVGALEPERATRIARDVVEQGFRTIKLKGGRSVGLDLEIARCVREAVGDEVALRLDPNGSYDLGEGRRLAHGLERFALEYLEDPCAFDDLASHASLRRASSIPIALDQAVSSPRRVVEIHSAGAADVLLLELDSVGGLPGLQETAATALACGLPLSMHAGYCTGVRTAEVVHLAASPAFRYAPDTLYHDLKEDVLMEPLRCEDGGIAVPSGPGLGVDVDPERVAALAVYSLRRTLGEGAPR